MGKAKENQTTNLRKCRCSCTIDGQKHNTIINPGEGFIIRTTKTDYKVYCKECTENITKATNQNLKIAEDKIATLQGDTELKVMIKKGWNHTFEFYINNNNITAINLLKRMHFTVTKGTMHTMKVISGRETNLNGLQKNFRSLVENFNVSEETNVMIKTYNGDVKINNSKETLLNAIAKAKESRSFLIG